MTNVNGVYVIYIHHIWILWFIHVYIYKKCINHLLYKWYRSISFDISIRIDLSLLPRFHSFPLTLKGSWPFATPQVVAIFLRRMKPAAAGKTEIKDIPKRRDQNVMEIRDPGDPGIGVSWLFRVTFFSVLVVRNHTRTHYTFQGVYWNKLLAWFWLYTLRTQDTANRFSIDSAETSCPSRNTHSQRESFKIHDDCNPPSKFTSDLKIPGKLTPTHQKCP